MIVINTCAVRAHAEDRVLGNVGALVHTKAKKPSQIICLCGCMMGEDVVVEKVRASYRHVDIVFDTHALWRFPELLQRVLRRRGRVFETPGGDGAIAEGIPLVRQNALKSWVSVMYGCNNFCSYCIVPYVRGRERSRAPEDILDEVKGLLDHGCKEINLLGQNVNSYGKDLKNGWDFPRLLREICALSGDFLVRFMTSHPKDASEELFDAMAASPKVAHHLHLPFQCGNDRVLKAMNRGYTVQQYLEKVAALRARIPDIVLTSDVIVGFLGRPPPNLKTPSSSLRPSASTRSLPLSTLPAPVRPPPPGRMYYPRRKNRPIFNAWLTCKIKFPRKFTRAMWARPSAASSMGRGRISATTLPPAPTRAVSSTSPGTRPSSGLTKT